MANYLTTTFTKSIDSTDTWVLTVISKNAEEQSSKSINA
jgi:hypothetical protein